MALPFLFLHSLPLSCLSHTSSSPCPLLTLVFPVDSPQNYLSGFLDLIVIFERVRGKINSIICCLPFWPLFQGNAGPWPAVCLIFIVLDTFLATCPIWDKFLASCSLRDRSKASQSHNEQFRLISWVSFPYSPGPPVFLASDCSTFITLDLSHKSRAFFQLRLPRAQKHSNKIEWWKGRRKRLVLKKESICT